MVPMASTASASVLLLVVILVQVGAPVGVALLTVSVAGLVPMWASSSYLAVTV